MEGNGAVRAATLVLLLSSIMLNPASAALCVSTLGCSESALFL